MGLLTDWLRRPKDVQTQTQWATVTEYAPSFTTFDGSIYEQEITRACIDRFAVAASKLKPEIYGNAHPAITRAIHTMPNKHETWPTFIKKVATRYDADAIAYVIPTYMNDGRTKDGFASMRCATAEIVEFKGEPWVRFYLFTGEVTSLPLSEVCILSKYTYISDFFSDPNCLQDTMQLIHGQNEAQRNAIEHGAQIRFIGALNGQVREEDMEAKRKRFIKQNLGPDNSEGLMLYDQTFSDIKQVEPHSYVIENREMERIDKRVYQYFGMNEKILTNDYDEDIWGAWYEGKVEPFAVALGDGLTKLSFTQRQQQFDNRITFSSSRLEYASNASKRNMIRDMVDRGILTFNQALEILQMPTIGEEGDIRVIRGEYVNASAVSRMINNPGASQYDTDGKNFDYDPKKIDTDKNSSDEDLNYGV